MTCDIARANHGLRYTWVDTCCIDKSSSAELSEAINSMYHWYRRSKICYVYLNDWTSARGTDWATLDDLSNGPKPLRWFTRGWTLQELIAPSVINFYDQTWAMVGTKSNPQIITELARITGISSGILTDGSEANLRKTCLGQRMSWASYRETTRKEDLAYCLFGIFHVNMPLLYGEGSRAFHRLQEEIIKTSTDLSLLAWRSYGPRSNQTAVGVLSVHPREFRSLSDCVPTVSLFSEQEGEEAVMTNKGLRLHTSSIFTLDRSSLKSPGAETFCLSLGCTTKGRNAYIVLRSISDSSLIRVNPFLNTDEHFTIGLRMKPRTMYILSQPPAKDSSLKHRADLPVSLRSPSGDSMFLSLVDTWPRGLFRISLNHEPTVLVGKFNLFVGYFELAVCSDTELFEFPNLIVVVHRLQLDAEPSIHLLSRDEAAPVLSLRETLRTLDPVKAESMLFETFNPSLLPASTFGVKEPHTHLGKITTLFSDADASLCATASVLTPADGLSASIKNLKIELTRGDKPPSCSHCFILPAAEPQPDNQEAADDWWSLFS
ncbi:hypothetical protein B0T14DRAFT_523601 [Immersiella caudata]|uniref:Heterokaryon incompatibility domain-containing protein n=1 Tax=Immersiella caudata TaxID=314043 RepID=A0AA39WJT5_9PEZI|nr:hypothetical protein B0T14DRAFT_523601 [Immersiella caudata]